MFFLICWRVTVACRKGCRKGCYTKLIISTLPFWCHTSLWTKAPTSWCCRAMSTYVVLLGVVLVVVAALLLAQPLKLLEAEVLSVVGTIGLGSESGVWEA